MDLQEKKLKKMSDRNVLIVGAGSSIKTYNKKIQAFIKEKKVLTFGINNMTSFCVPDFHLWTNRQRLGKYGSCINKDSTLLFSIRMPKKIIRDHYKDSYISVDYIDNKAQTLGYKNGIITGHFRTAGTLAIFIAHLMKPLNIYIAGMDGFTLYEKKDVKKGNKSHHCYGSGYTDDATWEECKEKDQMVADALNSLHEYGVKFTMITPTKFEQFYDCTILGVS